MCKVSCKVILNWLYLDRDSLVKNYAHFDPLFKKVWELFWEDKGKLKHYNS
jgi:hypothetical protein